MNEGARAIDFPEDRYDIESTCKPPIVGECWFIPKFVHMQMLFPDVVEPRESRGNVDITPVLV